MPSGDERPSATQLIEALVTAHREEVATLNAEILVLRELLAEHGHTPPSEIGALALQHFRACRRAAEHAYALLDTMDMRAALAEIRSLT